MRGINLCSVFEFLLPGLFILLTQLKRDLEKVRHQNADLKRDVQGLRTAVTKKEEKNIVLEVKIGGMEAERQKLESDLKEMKEDLEKKNIEKDETKKKLEGYFKQVTDLHSQVEENNLASSTRVSTSL